jgi:hypothetical protein
VALLPKVSSLFWQLAGGLLSREAQLLRSLLEEWIRAQSVAAVV